MKSAGRAGTILYVEDEESDAFFMKMAFADLGMERALRVVSTGQAAIDYLSGDGVYGNRAEHPLPSLVLLDLNLPAMPGFEVLKWIRQRGEHARTPVVIFSSSPRDEDREMAIALGANGFLEKPASGVNFDSIVQALTEKWLARDGA